jgi:hypothetical protein
MMPFNLADGVTWCRNHLSVVCRKFLTHVGLHETKPQSSVFQISWLHWGDSGAPFCLIEMLSAEKCKICIGSWSSYCMTEISLLFIWLHSDIFTIQNIYSISFIHFLESVLSIYHYFLGLTSARHPSIQLTPTHSNSETVTRRSWVTPHYSSTPVDIKLSRVVCSQTHGKYCETCTLHSVFLNCKLSCFSVMYLLSCGACPVHGSGSDCMCLCV